MSTRIDWESRLPTRRGLLFAIRHNYPTRLHMALIVGASLGTGLLVTRFMLWLGYQALWPRYLLALVMAYATFFLGVWVWLHLSRYGMHMRSRSHGDAGTLDVPGGSSGGSSSPSPGGFRGGQGDFDGGGASADWSGGEPLSSSDMGLSDGGLPDIGGADVGFDLDVGEGLPIVIVAIVAFAVLFVVFGGAVYVVWEAPIILTEVVFEVLLASSLIRGVKASAARDWSAVLFRKTIWAFAAIVIAAMLFATVAAHKAPQAKTASEAVRVMMEH